MTRIRWFIRNLLSRAQQSIQTALGYPSIRRSFERVHGYPLDLQNPMTHSEKVHCRKLFDRNPLFPVLSDKYRAREFVAGRLGRSLASQLQVPIKAHVRNVDALTDAQLATPGMLKATHGSGWNIALGDDDPKWIAEVRRQARSWLGKVQNQFRFEWAYRDLDPHLLLEDRLYYGAGGPRDFKIYCYDGVCRWLMPERQTETGSSFSIFDVNWQLQDMNWPGIAPCVAAPPSQLDEMKSIAEKLSAGFDALRVDFLITPDRFYLGELTLYDGGGRIKFDSYESDAAFGRYWHTSPPARARKMTRTPAVP